MRRNYFSRRHACVPMLRLINSASIHDLHAIMNRLDMMDSAALIGDILPWTGVGVCTFAIVHGGKYLYEDFYYVK